MCWVRHQAGTPVSRWKARRKAHRSPGAGRLRIASGAGAGKLLEGDFSGGLDLKPPEGGTGCQYERSIWFFPFGLGGRATDWPSTPTRIPFSLNINTGRQANMDLADLRLELRIQWGGSSSS
jgi:hypothetical protein